MFVVAYIRCHLTGGESSRAGVSHSFLRLCPFNTYSSSWCGDPPNKIIPLLLHDCNFATVVNHDVNI